MSRRSSPILALLIAAACAAPPPLAFAAAPAAADSARAPVAITAAPPADLVTRTDAAPPVVRDQRVPVVLAPVAAPKDSSQMPWQITLYESRDAARIAGGGQVPIGAMFPAIDPGEDLDGWLRNMDRAIGSRYLREHRHLRPPMVVKLPDGTEFDIDFRSSPEIHRGTGEGWSCTGTPPLITLSPSVHIIGRYHGWIGCNGVQPGWISDELEHRQYPHAT